MSTPAGNRDREEKGPAPRGPVVLAVTGASGVVYGQRLLECLLAAGEEVHLTVSDSARQVFWQEQRIAVQLESGFDVATLVPHVAALPGTVHYHHYRNWFTPIASGSFRTRAMAICPCSGGTLSGIARGSNSNLIHRAAEVHLKERRKLVLVTRETPLSLVQIENMRAVTLAGAVVLPASPGFYHGVSQVEQLVDFVVARVLDQLDVANDLIRRWDRPDGLTKKPDAGSEA